MIGIAVLGSTGSVGVNTLDVVARHPDRYRVVSLAAHRDVDGMYRQCLAHRPQVVAMADPAAAAELAGRLAAAAPRVEVLSGPRGVVEAACLPEADYVMAAIVGAAGLVSTLEAVRRGKRILLANKETLVVSGAIFVEAARASGAVVMPIDSEHNAIFQCMPPAFAEGLAGVGVRRILLTASGGPFRTWSAARTAAATPAEACAHPNWDMGRKISVDSATMMNKGLEVIEARWLFDAGPDKIQVVVHPQSVIHSMVEYVDGSVLAQLGNPDMRTPIAHALAWPSRIDSGVAGLDLFAVARLDFEPPDLRRFRCLQLAYDAVAAGGSAPAVLNAANEVAVAAFLAGRLGFAQIPELIDRVCQGMPVVGIEDLDAVLAIDAEARCHAEQLLQEAV
jgi:1-deoxy-D-xylulose-5-phosphate reductoisomerase